MNEVDDAILEFFREMESISGERVELQPGTVHHNIAEVRGYSEKSRSTFSRRIGDLEKIGLLELTDETKRYYRITEKGLAYLEGEIKAEELEPDE
ncbi:hypothetical protein [Halogeometricum borinquense]|nr:hypothetical protein [Halogeometricum borinquense]ADQ68467.1 hypothetical protein Hbor_29280 [Halogeometricum borinquense DSM 11551]